MNKKLSTALYVVLGMLTAAPATAEEMVSCPAILKSFVALEDKSSSQNWLLGGPRQTFNLKNGRVFIGKLSEESIQPSAEIRPIPHIERIDDKKVFVQVWNLESPGFDNALLICDYSGTDNYLIYALDASIAKCQEVVPVGKSDTIPTRVECE